MIKTLFSLVIFLNLCGCSSHYYANESQESESVRFLLRLQGAGHVQFASSLDNYQLHDTQMNGLGFWEITIPLPPQSTYFYMVDGHVFVPDCLFRQMDDFGSMNCLYLP